MALLLDAQHASLRRLVEAVATVYAEGHTRRRAEQELNNSLAVIENSVLNDAAEIEPHVVDQTAANTEDIELQEGQAKSSDVRIQTPQRAPAVRRSGTDNEEPDTTRRRIDTAMDDGDGDDNNMVLEDSATADQPMSPASEWLHGTGGAGSSTDSAVQNVDEIDRTI